MQISVAEAHSQLSRWLKRVHEDPITVTNRGKPVGVIISPEYYERLRRVEAYLQMLNFSRSSQEEAGTIDARELYELSRKELEDRT
ncbi:MAG: type II toxin-antitoxin system Phd/YefM family antitoxin [Chloroflexi bacterium]|nr:type II toxin-antitoxin system Phd/YefM family antitoxin [Chloroflexota bacterium]